MIDKLSPRALETSKDNRLKAPSALLDALNIIITGDADGGSGAIKNIRGTDSVSMSSDNDDDVSNITPVQGENTVIGSVRDESLGVVYFFVHNSDDNHGVYAYSERTNTYRLILMSPTLNFPANGFVKADVIRIDRRIDEPFTPWDETEEGEDEEEVFLPCSIPEWINDSGILDADLITQNPQFLPAFVSLETALFYYPGMVCIVQGDTDSDDAEDTGGA
tara:strand:+ start:8538 stop:9197 length:660 start_codon:yes stop_codon:yes gene_type:complete